MTIRALLGLFVIFVATSNAFANDSKKLIISSGNITGVYYPTAGAICREVNLSKDKDMSCLVRATNGSFQALSELQGNKSNLAIAQSDIINDAYNATRLLTKDKPQRNLRGVFSLYEDIFTIIVRADSKINSFDDTKNKSVSYGIAGSGTFAMLNAMMNIKNWQMSDFAEVVALSPFEQSTALCDGKIDVVMFAVAHPNGAIQEVTNSCDVRFISLNPQEIKALTKGNKNYVSARIDAGIYNAKNDVHSISAKAALVTRANMSNEVVYDLTKTVFASLPVLRTLHPVLARLDSARMPFISGNIPLHPGAKKYYVEAGLLKE